MLVLWLWSIKLLALAHLATAPKVISDDLRWMLEIEEHGVYTAMHS